MSEFHMLSLFLAFLTINLVRLRRSPFASLTSHRAKEGSSGMSIAIPEMGSLPYDVLSEIAERLCDSKQALSAFASSSRVLHSAGRRHLFRKVNLKSGERLREFISLLERSSSIAPWVNELSLVVRDRDTIHALSMTSSHWAFHALRVLPDMLPQMLTLEIHGLYLIQSILSSALATHFSKCTAVRTLSFSGCYFPKSFLQQTVYALPNISHLKVINVALLRDAEACVLKEPSSVRLRSIECSAFSAGMADEFITWMVTATSLADSLRTVTLHENSLDASRKLIALLGATLERLYVVTLDDHGIPLNGKHISFFGNPTCPSSPKV